MLRARPVSADPTHDLELALARLGVPPAERAALVLPLRPVQLLLTGLTDEARHFLAAPAGAGPSHLPGRAPDAALLVGPRDAFEPLLERARRAPALAGLVLALERALAPPAAPAPLALGGRTLAFGARTHVMGVVNVTPDSFSDGGRYAARDAAVRHALALARAGADVLDVGGESTRPGAARVGADEEAARVVPVLRALRDATDVPLSVDTTKAEVAREALAAGAALVNDVSGLLYEPALAGAVAEAGAALCVMHLRGTPDTMQQLARYDDVVDEVLDGLEAALARAEAHGVPRERLLVDPGVGFAKTFGHNLFLLRRLGDLRLLGRPVLVGTSRKAFLGHLTGGKPPGERLAATLGSVACAAVQGGADLVRVHDVAEARDALAVADAVRSAQEGGRRWEGSD